MTNREGDRDCLGPVEYPPKEGAIQRQECTPSAEHGTTSEQLLPYKEPFFTQPARHPSKPMMHEQNILYRSLRARGSGEGAVCASSLLRRDGPRHGRSPSLHSPPQSPKRRSRDSAARRGEVRSQHVASHSVALPPLRAPPTLALRLAQPLDGGRLATGLTPCDRRQ